MSAFPLTPIADEAVDERAFVGLITNMVEAGVDSIGALGSTGSYAYLDREERRRIADLAVQNAAGIPVMVGIGALRTREVLRLAEDAQQVGAAAVLLAPMTYQHLTVDEVHDLYERVDRNLSVPMCVYDNPATTHFTFTDDLYERVSALPSVKSIKIPGVSADPDVTAVRVQALRTRLPDDVAIGVSGDHLAPAGLLGGCDLWFSVIAGVLPRVSVALTSAAQTNDRERVAVLMDRLDPIWRSFTGYGSLRVASAIAEDLGLVQTSNLPHPVTGLPADVRAHVRDAVNALADLV
ncbi:dihydrodipicolinate synthase family protein [Rhodococcoides trifolii]|uniref:dihydrodipicolinate synthase family protein n=1 Tax=Rhodococcoides trifolii TaxID=908250 RepID=UPI001E5AFC3D|nr:dihydrodipicolinate synthase family protein [Rhodococcus trifolii]